MVDVWVFGQGEDKFLVHRSRNFSGYTAMPAFQALPDTILQVAQGKKRVNVYDLGCGNGNASSDIFDVLTERAHSSDLDPGLIDRVHYVGIDKVSGDRWKDSKKTTFIEGEIHNSLKREVHQIDIGLSYYVLPYVEDKVETVQQIYHSLSNGGSAIIDPFFPHQIVDQDDSPLDLSLLMPERSFSLNKHQLTLQKNEFQKGRVFSPLFSHTSLDKYDYIPKNDSYEGHPGQLVSHYIVPKR